MKFLNREQIAALDMTLEDRATVFQAMAMGAEVYLLQEDEEGFTLAYRFKTSPTASANYH